MRRQMGVKIADEGPEVGGPGVTKRDDFNDRIGNCGLDSLKPTQVEPISA